MPPSPPPKTIPKLVFSKSVLSDFDLMSNIIASMSDGVMLIKSEGEIVLVNPALCATLGIPAEKFSQFGWAELFFANEDNESFNQILVEAVQEHAVDFTRQVTYHRPDGQPRQLIVHATVIADDQGQGGLQSVLLVINDISDLMKLHEAERRLQAFSQRLSAEKLEGLDRLARAVAHEIRNPVTTVGGLLTRLLKTKSPASRDADYLNRAMAGVRRLETIVSQVRAYADLPRPQRQEIDMGAWLAELAEEYRSEAEQFQIKLVLTGMVGKPDRVSAQVDLELLKRALSSLLDNAIEAMPEGGTLTVGLDAVAGMVNILIADTGPGIEPDDLPYLFDPFFTTRANAVGMSLAIARRVALEHQGDLTVLSQAGKGAAFTFSIPPVPIVQPAIPATPPRPANPK